MSSPRLSAMAVSILMIGSVHTLLGQSLAPSVLASAGGYFQNGGGSISWTLGEPVIATEASGGIIITQGFHQPTADFSTAIVPFAPPATANIGLFPNPTRDQVVLFMGNSGAGASYALFDALGRRVITNRVQNDRTTIDLNGLASGNYLVRVSDAQSTLLATFKLTIAQ